MADRIEDGGPAFPVSAPLYEGGMTGMSLRDWFAANSVQPGAEELISHAGLETNTSGLVLADGSFKSFSSWWWTLPNAERFRLCSELRYEQADAMLSARQKGGA